MNADAGEINESEQDGTSAKKLRTSLGVKYKKENLNKVIKTNAKI